MDKAFSGDIEIQDDEWQLHAKQFIVREGEISFHFVGHDDGGDFKASGKAKKTDSGVWEDKDVKIEYLQRVDYICSIRIEKCEVKNDSLCEIEGVWSEKNSDGDLDEWRFDGDLTKFKPDESDH